jgi:hypothetical protein
MDGTLDLEAFGRRESEILQRLADRREETISALVRELVLQTIGEVEELIQKNPEKRPAAADESPPIR